MSTDQDGVIEYNIITSRRSNISVSKFSRTKYLCIENLKSRNEYVCLFYNSVVMMMIAFITIKSSLVPLIEGLCTNGLEFSCVLDSKLVVCRTSN